MNRDVDNQFLLHLDDYPGIISCPVRGCLATKMYIDSVESSASSVKLTFVCVNDHEWEVGFAQDKNNVSYDYNWKVKPGCYEAKKEN